MSLYGVAARYDIAIPRRLRQGPLQSSFLTKPMDEPLTTDRGRILCGRRPARRGDPRASAGRLRPGRDPRDPRPRGDGLERHGRRDPVAWRPLRPRQVPAPARRLRSRPRAARHRVRAPGDRQPEQCLAAGKLLQAAGLGQSFPQDGDWPAQHPRQRPRGTRTPPPGNPAGPPLAEGASAGLRPGGPRSGHRGRWPCSRRVQRPGCRLGTHPGPSAQPAGDRANIPSTDSGPRGLRNRRGRPIADRGRRRRRPLPRYGSWSPTSTRATSMPPWRSGSSPARSRRGREPG